MDFNSKNLQKNHIMINSILNKLFIMRKKILIINIMKISNNIQKNYLIIIKNNFM